MRRRRRGAAGSPPLESLSSYRRMLLGAQPATGWKTRGIRAGSDVSALGARPRRHGTNDLEWRPNGSVPGTLGRSMPATMHRSPRNMQGPRAQISLRASPSFLSRLSVTGTKGPGRFGKAGALCAHVPRGGKRRRAASAGRAGDGDRRGKGSMGGLARAPVSPRRSVGSLRVVAAARSDGQLGRGLVDA